jgi:hypothetical protein
LGFEGRKWGCERESYFYNRVDDQWYIKIIYQKDKGADQAEGVKKLVSASFEWAALLTYKGTAHYS